MVFKPAKLFLTLLSNSWSNISILLPKLNVVQAPSNAISQDNQVIELPFCRVTISGNSVLNEFKDDLTIEVEDIKKLTNITGSIVERTGKLCTVCSIVPQYTIISKEAREYSSQDEVHQNAIASAAVIKGLAHRILGNFFTKVQKPAKPFRLFNDLEEALAWLDAYKE